jgi:hypothetical protein
VFALGALTAAAAMVRPTFWFYPVVLLALLAVRFRGLRWRSLLIRLLACALPVVLVVGGWQLRNHSTVGSWDISGDRRHQPVLLQRRGGRGEGHRHQL